MSQFPETRISLILRLAAIDDVEAWREFASIYAPAVFAVARRRGLQAADAEDFVQELLLAVAGAAQTWTPDKQRARFRTWLYRVARNLLADHFSKRSSSPVCSDTGQFPQEIVDPSSASIDWHTEFELEYRRALFHRAAAIIRQRVNSVTWESFHATAIDRASAVAVSKRLGISVGSIYVARSRVMKLLRQEIERLEQARAVDRDDHDEGLRSLIGSQR